MRIIYLVLILIVSYLLFFGSLAQLRLISNRDVLHCLGVHPLSCSLEVIPSFLWHFKASDSPPMVRLIAYCRDCQHFLVNSEHRTLIIDCTASLSPRERTLSRHICKCSFGNFGAVSFRRVSQRTHSALLIVTSLGVRLFGLGTL